MANDSNIINFRAEKFKRSIKTVLMNIVNPVANFFIDMDNKTPGYQGKKSKNKAISKKRKVY
jgi:hypothetical protein